jgi:hypothetical protein
MWLARISVGVQVDSTAVSPTCILWSSGSSHCGVLQSGKAVSEVYTASIFIAEMSKFGEVAGYVEIGG